MSRAIDIYLGKSVAEDSFNSGDVKHDIIVGIMDAIAKIRGSLSAFTPPLNKAMLFKDNLEPKDKERVMNAWKAVFECRESIIKALDKIDASIKK